MWYTKEHEWIAKVDGSYKMGITDYAQSELGDVVFVDFPDAGAEFAQGETALNVESVKAVSDVYLPIAGKILAVNEALNDSPQLINESPVADGWLLEVDVADEAQLDTLMNEEDYKSYVSELSK